MKLFVMKKVTPNKTIPSETIAAYLDGQATVEECEVILDALQKDASLRELFRISMATDFKEPLPMAAMAANCEDNCRCCIKCESYILQKRSIPFNEQTLENNAVKNGWLADNGTALYNVGKLLESFGLTVSRTYGSCITDISNALNEGKDIIVAVDGGELTGDRSAEFLEDINDGYRPDHTVVVLSCDTDKRLITMFDPNSTHKSDTYSFQVFLDAWADSNYYMVIINPNGVNNYIPRPIDISDVELNEDLNELREAIAENAHEVWAENRMAEGWTYGPQRNDVLKQTPDMVPYSQLPESEKRYDREMAVKTIKLLIKLGYDIVKRK